MTLKVVTLFKRLYRSYDDHAVPDTSAALAYYFVFSLFPFLFFLVTLTAYLPLGDSVGHFLDRLRPVMPSQVMSLIDKHVRSLVEQPHPKLLTFGLFITLYSASRGVDAVRKGLNLAYDVKESRPFWRTELLAVGMTIGGAILVLFGVTALVSGGQAGFWMARHLGIGSVYVFVWKWLHWPVTAGVMMLAAAMGYYFLPDVEQQFKYITPGSIVGTLVWLLSTWGFAQYVAHFGNYNVTYGSIGGVIVLMTWFFISGFIFLMGGELNATLEHASVRGKRKGARSEGEAAPPVEERPSAMPAGAAGHAKVAERSPGGVPPTGQP